MASLYLSESMQLYPFQTEFIRDIYSRIRDSETAIACVSPTGSGKTVCMTKIIADAVAKGRTVLLCIDINVLIPQTIDKFKKWDSWHKEQLAQTALNVPRKELFFQSGVIQGKTPEYRGLPIQIASLQSMTQKRREWARDFPWDLIIFDEAHMTAWRKVSTELIEKAKERGSWLFGFTATPYRLSKRQNFGDIFDTLVYSRTPSQLQEMGFLAPMRYFSFPEVDLSAVKVTRGEFNQGDLAIAVNKIELVEHIYDQWSKLVPGKSTLAFCVSVDHAHTVADYFNSRGVPSAVVTGDTPIKERECLYEKIQSGELIMLASVNVVSTGFDAPSIEVGLGLRPTKSLALFHQQIGRIMRTFPGKTCGYWLDQAGNLSRPELMLPEHICGYDLEEKSVSEGGSGEAPHRFCEPDKTVDGGSCGSINHASATVCSSCGRQFLKKQAAVLTSDFIEVYVEAPTGDPKRDYYREQLRFCYRKGWSTAKAIQEYQTKYKDQYPQKSWSIGAVFGSKPTESHYEAYLAYLNKVAARKAVPAHRKTLISSWFGTEFNDDDAQNWLISKLYS